MEELAFAQGRGLTATWDSAGDALIPILYDDARQGRKSRHRLLFRHDCFGSHEPKFSRENLVRSTPDSETSRRHWHLRCGPLPEQCTAT